MLSFMNEFQSGVDLVTLYLAEQIREWLRANPSNTQAKMAAGAGVSTAAISDLRNAKKNPNAKTIRGVCRVLGRSWPDVEAAAVVWARDKGIAPPSIPDSCEARAEAIRRMNGILPPEVVTRLRAIAPNDDSVEDWMRIALEEKSVFDRTAARTAKIEENIARDRTKRDTVPPPTEVRLKTPANAKKKKAI